MLVFIALNQCANDFHEGCQGVRLFLANTIYQRIQQLDEALVFFP